MINKEKVLKAVQLQKEVNDAIDFNKEIGGKADEMVKLIDSFTQAEEDLFISHYQNNI